MNAAIILSSLLLSGSAMADQDSWKPEAPCNLERFAEHVHRYTKQNNLLQKSEEEIKEVFIRLDNDENKELDESELAKAQPPHTWQK